MLQAVNASSAVVWCDACSPHRLAPHSEAIKNLTAAAVQHRLAPVAPAFLLLCFSIWLLGPLLQWIHHAFRLVRHSYATQFACCICAAAHPSPFPAPVACTPCILARFLIA